MVILEAPLDWPKNPLPGSEYLVEIKTQGSVAISPDERAEIFLRDVRNDCEGLVADFPGSTFEPTLNLYGKGAGHLVFVDGPFLMMRSAHWPSRSPTGPTAVG